eukprot:11161750-Lingulodinium_polyedra.AAC.1
MCGYDTQCRNELVDFASGGGPGQTLFAFMARLAFISVSERLIEGKHAQIRTKAKHSTVQGPSIALVHHMPLIENWVQSPGSNVAAELT